MRTWTTVCAVLLMLNACEHSSLGLPADKTPMTPMAKLKACSLDEARDIYYSGNLMDYGLPAATEEVAGTCMKRLSLRQISEKQAQDAALNALMLFVER